MIRLTQDRLKELLSYDRDTGIFVWLIDTKNTKIGQTAGHVWHGKNNDYIQIGINGRLYYAHRLAWLYEKGSFPREQIDHEDGIGTHNWFSNFRPVSNLENSKNQRIRKNNTSGHLGVVWDNSRDMWKAQICIDGASVFLGRFSDVNEAIAARREANNRYGFHENHGRMKRAG